MNQSILWQLALFVVVLIILNTLFQLHISIIGSILLTLGLSFVFSLFRRKQ